MSAKVVFTDVQPVHMLTSSYSVQFKYLYSTFHDKLAEKQLYRKFKILQYISSSLSVVTMSS